MKKLLAFFAIGGALILASVPALGAEKGVGSKEGKSNFDRTHDAIDRNMQPGNDRSPRLGEGPGERTGIGGAPSGGNAPSGPNVDAINERNQ